MFLAAYVASPPLLASTFRHGTPGPPFDAIIEAVHKPLNMLYNSSPWYRQYVDATFGILVP
jgi:hypothetical protein